MVKIPYIISYIGNKAIYWPSAEWLPNAHSYNYLDRFDASAPGINLRFPPDGVRVIQA
jgi:hypothetical protein